MKMSKITVQKHHVLTGHRDSVYALVQGNTTQEILSAGSDGFVVKWDLGNPENGFLIARFPNSVYAIYLIAGANKLIVGQNYAGVHLIDLENNKEVTSSSITQSAIFDIQIYKKKLFVGCGDGTLAVLDINDLATNTHVKLSEKSIRCMAINPTLQELAIGYSDCFIRILDLNTLALKYEIQAHQNSVFSLTYSPDYQYLLSGSRDAHLKIWEVYNNYSLRESIVAHLFTINHVAYHPSSSYFATCSKDKSIKLWDAKQFKLLKVIDKARYAGHSASINKLLWANNLLLACSDDRSISVWDIKGLE
jgi:WD40 repeat protein